MTRGATKSLLIFSRRSKGRSDSRSREVPQRVSVRGLRLVAGHPVTDEILVSLAAVSWPGNRVVACGLLV